MPVFRPPVELSVPNFTDRATPQQKALYRHFRPKPSGITVLKDQGGNYSQVVCPTSDQVDAAAIAYVGGHEYDVSVDEAAALTAAGYGFYVD